MIGGPALFFGGGYQRVGRVVEFWGGPIDWLLSRAVVRADAMALGHVILGRNPRVLAACRAHELVHVQQSEIFGPFFLPAYVLASLVAHLRGGHYYRDNPFEIDAVRRSSPF